MKSFVVLLCLTSLFGPDGLAQPKIRTLTEQELVDMMVGTSILSTRGSNTERMIQSVRDFRVEDITRGIAVASGGGVSVAANPVSGKLLKHNLIPGFLSKAICLGRAARQAVEAGKDPIEAILKAGSSFLLFKGIVRRSDSRGEKGFGWTDAYLDGVGEFSGSQYKIFNKNENMAAWRDGKLDAAAPDLICPLDPKTGWAMRGGDIIGSYTVGQELAIVGFANHPIWRTPKGIEMLGPRHFGFDEDYVPIEKLHAKGK